MFLKEKKYDFLKLYVNRFMIFKKTKIFLGNKISLSQNCGAFFFTPSYYLLILYALNIYNIHIKVKINKLNF